MQTLRSPSSAPPRCHVSRSTPAVTDLRRLLGARTAREQDRAWRSFLDSYSRLLLHVARSVARDHDDAMDGYAHTLEQLRADNYARLRAYAEHGDTKLSTWLVVVARRLCLDHYRQRYGRTRKSQSDAASREQVFRRRLEHLAGEDVEQVDLAAASLDGDEAVRAAELKGLLDAVLNTLDAGDRLLLKLRFEDDLAAQEIARLLHFATPFHVYRKLESLTAVLRRALKARGVESSTP